MDKTFEIYYAIAKEIIHHPRFQEQKAYIHHRDISVFTHAIHVSYKAYKIAKKLHLDADSVIRGALLHDFFLYDWHVEGKKTRKRLFKKHGFTHAKQAFQNASLYFTLNKKETDIIKKHMFPLNLVPPRYVESWLVNFVDTFITMGEIFGKRPDPTLMDYMENS